MLSNGCQRHRSFLKPPKLANTLKKSTSGTLSPDTITNTSSGYSTGGSSVSTTIVPSSKKSSSSIVQKQQHKTKSKGFHNLITKLKSFIISPKPKHTHSTSMRSTTLREISSNTILRQYSAPYDSPSTPITTSNTISLPFTYYHNSPIQHEYKTKQDIDSYVIKTTNFEKISAWLDHTDMTICEEQNDIDLLFIDESHRQSLSSSSSETDKQGINLIMKKTPSIIKTPKRSVSMVSTMTRPIIEQKQYERAVSPTSSFSSSILTRGMAETITPQKMYHQSRTNVSQEQSNNLIPKTNRRRAIDFSRRRTVAGPTEQMNNNNNKENVPIQHQQQIYQFSPSTSANTATRKYFFHPNPSMKNEDILMNSYGLTLLQQQQPQQPIRQRHSISSGVAMTSQAPDKSSIRTSQKPLSRRTSMNLKQQHTLDSLDDLLCDREVESYFYPNKRQQSPTSLPQHIYITLETTPNYYQLPPPPPPYIQGTLC